MQNFFWLYIAELLSQISRENLVRQGGTGETVDWRGSQEIKRNDNEHETEKRQLNELPNTEKSEIFHSLLKYLKKT